MASKNTNPQSRPLNHALIERAINETLDMYRGQVNLPFSFKKALKAKLMEIVRKKEKKQ